MLADLDFFFEVGKDEDGDWFWSLAPIVEPEGDQADAVRVVLLLKDSWLAAFCIESLESSLNEEQLKAILLLNPRLSGAKIGLIEDEDSSIGLWIGHELFLDQANLERLKLAIGAIAFAVRELRRQLRENSGGLNER